MNRKKLWIILAAGAGCIALAAAVIIGALYFRIRGRIDRLAKGCSFQAEYRLTLPDWGSTGNAAADLIDWTAFLEGAISGEKAEELVHLEIVPQEREELAAEVYRGGGQLLINAKRLYAGQKNKIAERIPLAGALLPEWSAGAYLSLEQLEEILGKELRLDILTDGIAWRWKDFFHIRSGEGGSEWLYFQLNHEAAAGYEIVAGIEKASLFRNAINFNLIIKKENQFELAIEGTVKPEADLAIAMPQDVMMDEDIKWLVTVREAVERAAGFFGK